MPSFKVKTPIRHDGEDYAAGETIDLTQKQADVIGPDTLDAINVNKGTSNGDGAKK